VSPRTRAPVAAILVGSAGAIGFALLGDLTFIASVTDFAVYVVFVAVNATVIILRRRAPGLARPFRTPGAIGRVPVLPVAGIVAALAMIPQLEPDSLVLGVALLALGLMAYRLLDPARASRNGPHGDRASVLHNPEPEDLVVPRPR